MATQGSSLFTLTDLAKRLDPNGKVADIAEILNQTNDVLSDIPWMEGNLLTGHRTTVRTGLPASAWRLLNKGVAVTKSTSAQIDEACGMLESRSQVDKDLAELGGNVSAVRLSEARPHLESMSQEFASTLFYGNSAIAPEEITGLAPRYATISGATNGQNVLSGAAAGGQTDCSSVWLVVWGENTIHGIYPKGSQAGLIHQDLGEGDAFDDDNNRFRAYMDRWQWKCGIALRDWRYVVRIANIDISALVAKTSAADLVDLMIKATHRLPNGPSGLKSGKPAFYMNRSCFQMLDIQRRDAVMAGGGLTFDNVGGMVQASFRGIPIRVCDALHENESVIS